MSVFEDLIEELKEENLLENTVMDVKYAASPTVTDEPAAPVAPVVSASTEPAETPVTATFPVVEPPQIVVSEPFGSQFSPEPAPVAPVQFQNPIDAFIPVPELKTPVAPEDLAFQLPLSPVNAEPVSTAPSADFSLADFKLPSVDEIFAAGAAPVDSPKLQLVEATRGADGDREYFRKRAMEEVTGLQMVEHVLSGIEREQMKAAPRPYDDLPVKLALHDFLQVAQDIDSTEHAQAEFKLMQETENWYSALSHRDKNVSVSHLRRFCETTRPALSAQALIALARFYRNSPFSESVRSKFDLVLTRLFSKELDGEQRELLLEHSEMTFQLKELYADWSSIQLYAVNENDPEIAVSTVRFNDFIREAETTGTFEELINNDFFNRLRLFKEGCQENFFAPFVAVAAVEANVRIGNRYIELLKKAKENFSVDVLEEKYGFLYDQTISDATGKTFELVSLLHERGQLGKAAPAEIVSVSVKNESQTIVKPTKKKSKKFLGANRFLIGLTFLTILICGGLYFWAEMESAEIKANPKVKKVNLENSEFKDFIQTARIDGENFIGITSPAWESLNSEKKQELLRKIVKVGTDKNFKKVTLINSGGRNVGYALGDRVEVYNQ